MTYKLDLLTGLARDLAEIPGAGVYNPDTPYRKGEHGIVLHSLPITPEHVTVVSSYNDEIIGTYNRGTETIATYVQIRLRTPDQDDTVTLGDRLRDRYDRTRRILTADSGVLLAVLGHYRSGVAFDADETGLFLASFNLAFTGTRERA